MERRKVAESHEYLAVWPQSPFVQKREEPGAAVASTQRYHGIYFRRLEIPHKFGGAVLVASGQVALRFEYAIVKANHKAEAFQGGDPAQEYLGFLQRARWRDDADGAPPFQGRRV